MITPNKQINNIYGYVRVSTTEQAINGISIDTQKDLINEFFTNAVRAEFLGLGTNLLNPHGGGLFGGFEPVLA